MVSSLKKKSKTKKKVQKFHRRFSVTSLWQKTLNCPTKMIAFCSFLRPYRNADLVSGIHSYFAWFQGFGFPEILQRSLLWDRRLWGVRTKWSLFAPLCAPIAMRIWVCGIHDFVPRLKVSDFLEMLLFFYFLTFFLEIGPQNRPKRASFQKLGTSETFLWSHL